MKKETPSAHEPGPAPVFRENLRRRFPLAFRRVFRRSIGWILGLAVFTGLAYWMSTLGPGEDTLVQQMFEQAIASLILVGCAFVLGKVAYEVLRWAMCSYEINQDTLIISQGVFFRTTGSLPVSKLTSVTLQREPLDLLFGLHNVLVTTPSNSEQSGSINGFSRRQALALQHYLLALATPEPITPESLREANDAAAHAESRPEGSFAHTDANEDLRAQTAEEPRGPEDIARMEQELRQVEAELGHAKEALEQAKRAVASAP